MPYQEVMDKWKHGKLHSGSKTGPVVHNQKQAVAIMLSEKRATEKNGGKYPEKAVGGPMMGNPMGGIANRMMGPATGPMGTTPGGMMPNMSNFASMMGNQYQPPPWMNGNLRGAPPWMNGGGNGQMSPQMQQIMQRMMGGYGGKGGMGLSGLMSQAEQEGPAMAAEMSGGNSGIAPTGPMQPRQLAPGGVANTGVGNFNMMKQANLTPSYAEKGEMRSMMHGPIMSSVPGRTDAHKTAVPSGSYVVPADIVSGRGQGNTAAGMNSLQKMFRMGPYGSSAGGIKPGRTMPSAFHMPKQAQQMVARGGKVHHMGKPVPVNLAGGELVVPPQNVLETVRRITGKGYTLEQAHEILDKWVINERKKLRETMAKLPGPVKD